MVNSDLTPSASYDPKDLVGTWTLVSVVTERDGRKFDSYGPWHAGVRCERAIFDNLHCGPKFRVG